MNAVNLFTWLACGWLGLHVLRLAIPYLKQGVKAAAWCAIQLLRGLRWALEKFSRKPQIQPVQKLNRA